MTSVMPSPGDELTSRDLLRVEDRGIAIVLTVEGVLGSVLPSDVADTVTGAASLGPIAVDLSRATLTSRDTAVAVAGLVLSRSTPGECCFVCQRHSGRRLLHTWGIARCGAVFGSLSDALQSREFALAGFGPGWHPTVGPLRAPAS